MNEAKRLLSDWCYMNCDAPPRPPEIAQIVETAYSVLDNGKQNSNAYSPWVPFESPILVHAATKTSPGLHFLNTPNALPPGQAFIQGGKVTPPGHTSLIWAGQSNLPT